MYATAILSVRPIRVTRGETAIHFWISLRAHVNRAVAQPHTLHPKLTVQLVAIGAIPHLTSVAFTDYVKREALFLKKRTGAINVLHVAI